MTTKTDITLPRLPGWMSNCYIRADLYSDLEQGGTWLSDLVNKHARAAVEADRQGRVPSEESINGLWRECTQAWNKGKTETPLVQQFARALLSRYSSGQPASCDCDDKSQCWEPCGDLGHDAEHAKLSRGQPAASVVPYDAENRCRAYYDDEKSRPFVTDGMPYRQWQAVWMAAQYDYFARSGATPVATPVAQEPVGDTRCYDCRENKSAWCPHNQPMPEWRRGRPCNGMNCGAMEWQNHSPECEAEHCAAIAGGKFVPGGKSVPVAQEPVGYFYPWELERSKKAYPNGYPGAVSVYAAPVAAQAQQDDLKLILTAARQRTLDYVGQRLGEIMAEIRKNTPPEKYAGAVVTQPSNLEPSRCANCGIPAEEASQHRTKYAAEGEWFCSERCERQHEILGCPQETHCGYRHPGETEKLLTALTLDRVSSDVSKPVLGATTALLLKEALKWVTENPGMIRHICTNGSAST